MTSRRVIFAVIGIALLASTAMVAQDVPVRNWQVPPFDLSMFTKPTGPSIRPLEHTQGNNPAVFVPFGPCRLTDSRVSSGGPGPISPATPRDYDFVPGGCPAIPGLQVLQTVSSPIIAWSLNFTVIDTAGPGFLFAYPTGGVQPPVAILNYQGTPGEIKNNAAIVPVDATTGSFTVATGVSGTNVIIDVNGVFIFELEINTSFTVRSTVDDAAIIGENISTAASAQGVRGLIASAAPGINSTAVRGINNGTAAFGIGVWGSQAGSGWGVNGSSVNGIGVRGINTSDAGATHAIVGINDSGSSNAAAIFGTINTDDDPIFSLSAIKAAIRGEGGDNTFGGLFVSEHIGLGGYLLDAAGAIQAEGWIAASFGVDAGGAPPWSFFGGEGDMGNVEVKSFVEPHPRDPSKIIQYISLEGPEAGTYFRGRGKFQNGIARITVPEDFRIVSDDGGLTVQVTPIGAMATVGVMKVDLNEIVVEASRDVEFSYLVQGVRRAYKDRTPVRDMGVFVPRSADSKMRVGYPDELKRRLIENGTYKADGTVNMETATRLGWDKAWAKNNPPAPEPAPE